MRKMKKVFICKACNKYNTVFMSQGRWFSHLQTHVIHKTVKITGVVL